MLECASNNGFCRNVLARVHHVKTVVAEQQRNNVFANIVNIAFDRGHHHNRAGFRAAPGLQQRLEVRKGGLHGFCRADELGQKIFPPFIARAHFRNSRNERFLHKSKGVGACIKLCRKQGQHIFLVAVEHGLGKGFGRRSAALTHLHGAFAGLPAGIGGYK